MSKERSTNHLRQMYCRRQTLSESCDQSYRVTFGGKGCFVELRTPHPSDELTKTAEEDGHADASVTDGNTTDSEVVERKDEDSSCGGEKTTTVGVDGVGRREAGESRCLQRSRIGDRLLFRRSGVGICVGDEGRERLSSVAVMMAIVVEIERPLL
jgi:hypothetical protein